MAQPNRRHFMQTTGACVGLGLGLRGSLGLGEPECSHRSVASAAETAGRGRGLEPPRIVCPSV